MDTCEPRECDGLRMSDGSCVMVEDMDNNQLTPAGNYFKASMMICMVGRTHQSKVTREKYWKERRGSTASKAGAVNIVAQRPSHGRGGCCLGCTGR